MLDMTGHEFERKIRKLGRLRGIPVSFDVGRGKGSHGRLYYGERFTTLKDRKKEIGPGLLKAMLEQLGLGKDSLEIP
jgi:mRNA interferase HicA